MTAPLPAPDQHGEWHHGHAGTQHTWTAGPAAVGYERPDPDGDTIYFRRLGWTRAELPELAAWLLEVHAASSDQTDGGGAA